MPRITFALATMLSFMAFTPVAAQDWLKGVDAFEAGDYATALKEWLPLAVQGNVDAQYNLGIMYQVGEGVPQNYAESAKWTRLAAEQGVTKMSKRYLLSWRQDDITTTLENVAKASSHIRRHDTTPLKGVSCVA